MCKEKDELETASDPVSPISVTAIGADTEFKYDIGSGFDDFELEPERFKPVQAQIKSSRPSPHEMDPMLMITMMLAMKKQSIAARNANHTKRTISGKFFSDYQALENKKGDAQVALSFL